jgi:hypothetical protein
MESERLREAEARAEWFCNVAAVFEQRNKLSEEDYRRWLEEGPQVLKDEVAKENLRLRAALERIRDFEPDATEILRAANEAMAEVEECVECRQQRARNHPITPFCDKHYRVLRKRDADLERLSASQHLEMKRIARAALATQPQPAAQEGGAE